jgi:RNase adapter protein RapZ
MGVESSLKKLDFVIITGMSGAGKTQAANLLEDIGFFCVDNLPPTLIPKFSELCVQADGKMQRIALVIDVREGVFLEDIFSVLGGLRKEGHRVLILFLNASDDSLVRRFSETRRPHPLAADGSLVEGIRAEREILSHLQVEADLVIDTSDYTVHEFRKVLFDAFEAWRTREVTLISLVSFGYKYGLPNYADLVFDLRLLPNPHFVEELRPMTGKDQRVIDFILKEPQAISYVEKLTDFLHFTIPLHIKEGKSYLTICLGCTGGRHRSVTLVEDLARKLREMGYSVHVRHRDIDKGVDRD